MSLPILESCDGCGACCMRQSSPPGYVYILCTPEAERGKFVGTEFRFDAERVKALPPEVRAELDQYIVGLRLGRGPRGEVPCLWFDQVTRKCKHHAHRPSICREFEMGSEDCHNWRKEFEVDRG